MGVPWVTWCAWVSHGWVSLVWPNVAGGGVAQGGDTGGVVFGGVSPAGHDVGGCPRGMWHRRVTREVSCGGGGVPWAGVPWVTWCGWVSREWGSPGGVTLAGDMGGVVGWVPQRWAPQA